MNRVIHAVAVAAAIAALSVTLAAQWQDYPLAGAPRNAKGEIDLNAPTPRTADGKPDFSGVWRGVGSASGPGAPQPAQPTDNSGPPVGGFRNIGSGFKDGLPFTPWGAEELKKRQAGNSKDNPEAHCLPMGIVQFHTQGFPRKFIQTPRVMAILYEASSGIRQIFTDGRKLPNDDPQPWYYGYSIGHWEGDTLVVESTGFRDDGWLDIIGSPMTDKAKVTERFRRVNYGRMEIDVTVDDPKAYTKPWTIGGNQQ